MLAQLIAIISYGVLSIGGGVMGYVKSQSKISLISGIASGILLLISAFVVNSGFELGLTVAAIIVALLVIVFIVRWLKTKKLVPALPMVFLGILTLVVILS